MKNKKKQKLSWANKGGSSIVTTYKRVWDPDTCRFIVLKTGEYDLAEKIQAANNISDLALFYKQLNAGLVPEPSNIGSDDVVGSDELLPRNIHEFKAKVNEAYASFGKLPNELRQIFNGDEALYLASLADGSYINKINDFLKKQAATPIATDKEGE